MDQAEASGKTVDDAFRAALAQLGADEDEVEMVILEEGRRSAIPGRGRDAIVRVVRKGAEDDEDEAEAAVPDIDGGDDTRPTPAPRAARPRGSRTRRPAGSAHLETAGATLTDADFLRPRGTPGAAPPAGGRSTPRPAPAPRDRDRDRGRRSSGGSDRPRREENVEPNINAEEVDFSAHVLDDILRILGIEADITIREPITPGDGRGGSLAVLDVGGEDLGVLIGRRGDTLSSLQHVINLVLLRRFPDCPGITVDIEHYRHRREEQLVSLAQRMADRVRRTGTPITLEPMPPADRRLIHIALVDDEDVQTYSVGEGDSRKVVISTR